MTKKKWEWLDQPITLRKFIKFEAVCCAISSIFALVCVIYVWVNTRLTIPSTNSAHTEEFEFETEE